MPDQALPPASITIDGQTYCLQHLTPTGLVVCTKERPEGVNLHVSFSKHCFTESFDGGVHARSLLVMDRGKQRAFDELRYDLSKGLPDMIAQLPDTKVFQTPEENFFQLSHRIDGQDGEYRMFFRVKKSGVPEGYDLRMFVESAYSPDPHKVLPTYKMQKVRFKLLVDKTLKGQSVRFNTKR